MIFFGKILDIDLFIILHFVTFLLIIIFHFVLFLACI